MMVLSVVESEMPLWWGRPSNDSVFGPEKMNAA